MHFPQAYPTHRWVLEKKRRIAGGRKSLCNSSFALFERFVSGLRKQLQYCAGFRGVGPMLSGGRNAGFDILEFEVMGTNSSVIPGKRRSRATRDPWSRWTDGPRLAPGSARGFAPCRGFGLGRADDQKVASLARTPRGPPARWSPCPALRRR